MNTTTLVWFMIAGSALAWVVASLIAPELSVPVLLGVSAPLAVVTTDLLRTERAYKRDPSTLTALMIKAFAGKMIFFGAYVALMLGVLAVSTIPFVVSFTASFIVLYAAEAGRLWHLFAATNARPDATS